MWHLSRVPRNRDPENSVILGMGATIAQRDRGISRPYGATTCTSYNVVAPHLCGGATPAQAKQSHIIFATVLLIRKTKI